MQINSISSGYGTESVNIATQKRQAEFAEKLKQAEQLHAGQQTPQQQERLKTVCKDMESVFINYLLTQMRKTVPESSLLGHSNQQKIMESMLDSEMAKKMSTAGGIGLADMIYRQLTLNSQQTNKNLASK